MKKIIGALILVGSLSALAAGDDAATREGAHTQKGVAATHTHRAGTKKDLGKPGPVNEATRAAHPAKPSAAPLAH